MRAFNPYTPGAGFMPTVLAGRDDLLEKTTIMLENLQRGYPQRSVVFFGLRGVGKTVLLNTIETAAENRDMLHDFIEATENALFKKRLIAAISRLVHQLSLRENAAALAQRCADLLKSFRLSYGLEDQKLSLEMWDKPVQVTGIYEEDLTEVFLHLGKTASKAACQICLFLDEMQYLSGEDIAALISAMHRCNQLRLPVILFCAGLPKIKRMVGEARSYSERLFAFEEIGALDESAAIDAITGPAEREGIEFEEAAVAAIIRVTERYPYFLQELCSVVWEQTEQARITEADVNAATDAFYKRLDQGFFSIRYERCSNGERDFMTAMVQCGALPCTISKVASILGKTVRSVSPIRAKLINKGLIFATGHAEIDFTVPQFDGFLRRMNPELGFVGKEQSTK